MGIDQNAIDKYRHEGYYERWDVEVDVDVDVDMDVCVNVSVDIDVGVDALEKELAALIMSKQIPARIDSQSKVLYARHTDQRTATFAAAVKMGEDYMRDTKALLLRINLMRADFIVKGTSGGSDYGPSKSSRQDGRNAPGFQQNAEFMEGM